MPKQWAEKEIRLAKLCRQRKVQCHLASHVRMGRGEQSSYKAMTRPETLEEGTEWLQRVEMAFRSRTGPEDNLEAER
jgi:hypothetical protein